MSDALTRAKADADRMRISAASKQRGSSADLLASSPSGIPYKRPSLARAKEQFEHSKKNWAAVAIRAIAQRIAAQDLHVARIGRPGARKDPTLQLPGGRFKALGDRLEPLDDHELLQAVADPNELMVRWALIVSTVAGMLATGRAYWWWSDNGLWPLPASWMEPADNLRRG